MAAPASSSSAAANDEYDVLDQPVADGSKSRKRPLPPTPDDGSAKRVYRGAPVPNEDVLQQLQAIAAPAAAASPPVAAAPDIVIEEDPHMFYEDKYDLFNADSLITEGEPQTSTVGGGKMMFLLYKYPDGVVKPLCVQAPKMFTPGGAAEFSEEGSKPRTSILCSLGANYASNPNLVAFKSLCDKIQSACAKLCMTKRLQAPFYTSLKEVEDSFSSLVFCSEKATDEDPPKIVKYPPSIKLAVNTSANYKSVLVTKASADRFITISPSSIVKGCSIIPMIHFQWVYRKKRAPPLTGWGFSIRCSVYQAVVDMPRALGSGSQNKLAIILKD